MKTKDKIKFFWEGFYKGMSTYGLVAGGAIGGMVLMHSLLESDTSGVVAGIICIIANMLCSSLKNENKD